MYFFLLVFSDNIIAGQTFVFISGGSETVSAVLSFALYQLAVNRDIQRRLQEEIDSALSDQELTYESLKKMTYMEQILNGTNKILIRSHSHFIFNVFFL